MIDWKQSAELNGCTIEWLKARFIRFPNSAKRVVAICGICGNERNLRFFQYSDLCLHCAHSNDEFNKKSGENSRQYYIDNPEARETARLKTIEQFSIQEARDKISDWSTKYWSDPNIRKIKSDQMERSPIHSKSVEKFIGGNDIVNHHWLYDDADLSKYTMPMTRSEHTAMHNRMRSDGYEVPHINSDTDDNGLWGYR